MKIEDAIDFLIEQAKCAKPHRLYPAKRGCIIKAGNGDCNPDEIQKFRDAIKAMRPVRKYVIQKPTFWRWQFNAEVTNVTWHKEKDSSEWIEIALTPDWSCAKVNA